jgi:hypothetical protein
MVPPDHDMMTSYDIPQPGGTPCRISHQTVTCPVGLLLRAVCVCVSAYDVIVCHYEHVFVTLHSCGELY